MLFFFQMATGRLGAAGLPVLSVAAAGLSLAPDSATTRLRQMEERPACE
jgi:hypothetical protein